MQRPIPHGSRPVHHNVIQPRKDNDKKTKHRRADTSCSEQILETEYHKSLPPSTAHAARSSMEAKKYAATSATMSSEYRRRRPADRHDAVGHRNERRKLPTSTRLCYTVTPHRPHSHQQQASSAKLQPLHSRCPGGAVSYLTRTRQCLIANQHSQGTHSSAFGSVKTSRFAFPLPPAFKRGLPGCSRPRQPPS